ncbi:unnamed protein product, partial [Nesidiocoris tenuis]
MRADKNGFSRFFDLPSDPYDFQDQDDLNVVDTSSVKSGRNSRRRQQFTFANSSGNTQHQLVVGLLSILVLLRTF